MLAETLGLLLRALAHACPTKPGTPAFDITFKKVPKKKKKKKKERKKKKVPPSKSRAKVVWVWQEGAGGKVSVKTEN